MMNCRHCNSELKSIIPLGKMPLANSLISASEFPNLNEKKFNLEVMQCVSCGLPQLADLVPPQELFSNYLYFSSNSTTMVKSAKDLVDRLATTLNTESLVIEVASNDGYLLQHYLPFEIKVLGVEPAKNIAEVARSKGIETLNEFFSDELAKKLKSSGVVADVIHANNVMAHVPDINGFVKGIKEILKPEGVAIIEVPYFVDLVQKKEFDTIYHEHVYYFALRSLTKLFDVFDLEICEIEKLDIHGGTLRLFVRHKEWKGERGNVQQYIELEEKQRLFSTETFDAFMEDVNKMKSQLLEILTELKREGKKVVAYGASAKGATLLNYFGIGKDYLDFIVDKSPYKQGMYYPGVHLPIKDPTHLIKEKVDHALLLTWNFSEEILAEQDEFRKAGGKFIIPIPYLRVV